MFFDLADALVGWGLILTRLNSRGFGIVLRCEHGVGVAGLNRGAIIQPYWPGRGGGIGRHAVLRGQWACACVGSNPALGTTLRPAVRRPQRRAATERRRSQAVKAEVCKTSMRRFESARRLQKIPSRQVVPSRTSWCSAVHRSAPFYWPSASLEIPVHSVFPFPRLIAKGSESLAFPEFARS